MSSNNHSETIINAPEEQNGIKKPYLNWQDIAIIFDCKRSKALLIMHKLKPLYIGHSVFIKTTDLEAYLDKHHGVSITWPKR